MPRACEWCAYPADLKCSRCKESYYCGADCQSQAFPKHKKLCKLIALSKNDGTPMPDSTTYCGLCGATGPLTRTDCCNRVICDDADQYVMFSYGRQSCMRNHTRYTLCDTHKCEGHTGPDCQTCTQCKDFFSAESYAWYLTNAYVFPDKRPADAPSFPISHCSTCGARIKKNSEGFSSKPFTDIIWCNDCSNRRR